MAKKLYILDGHSQIYRAYHALRPGSMTSPTGEPTWATFVFTTMLIRILAERKPDYIAMAVDGPRAHLERTAMFPDYKANRPPMPDDLRPQEKRIFQIVEAMGIPVLRSAGQEADDVLATAAARFAGDEMDVILVSRDKDLDQLVGPHVALYDPTKDQLLDADTLASLRGYPTAAAVEVQTLMGDNIDNIPGIPGVGPKTAAQLIARYGTADNVLAHADEQTPKLRENLLAAGAERLAISRKLVTLNRSVPIDLDLEAMRFTGLQIERLTPLFRELGFNTLIERLGAKSGHGAPPAAAPSATDASTPASAIPQAGSAAVAEPANLTTAADFDYRCVDTPETLESLRTALAGVKRLAVDTETTGIQPMWAEMVGMSLSWQPGVAYYIPVRGPLGASTLDLDLVRAAIGPILADETVEKVGQNIKYDYLIFANAGMEIRGKIFDTMVAAHVLDSTRPSYSLNTLGAELVGHRSIPIEDVIGRGRTQTTMNAAPMEQVVPYACEDADVTLRVSDVLRKQLADESLTDLFERLEMPLLPVLAQMERRGVLVDPAVLKRMETELSKQADVLHDKIIAAAGHQFNPDSPKQLAVVLHDELGLPVLKRTKTGPSTDSSVLEELAISHELPGLVLDYRRLTKLIGTYLRSLATCIHPRTGRVHTIFHQAGTATGRLSSSDPNLQNIPVRDEEARRIRAAFVAPPGWLLLSADYSQVELRVLAHLCQDATMTAAFENDQDVHRIVAAEVFGVPVEQVTKEQRAKAKTVNFGIVYGQTAFGLSISLRIPRGEAQDFINRYRNRFPRIQEFLETCIKQAKQLGYVETIFGRRRKIAEIDSHNQQRRALAERLAINSVVQGSAADLIKQAMLNITRRIQRENRPSHMLLQIHDELLLEAPKEAAKAEAKMLADEMCGAIKLRVPLKVDVGIGLNWMEAK